MRWFLFLMFVVASMQRCSHPQGEDGDQVTEGCLRRTCKSNTWEASIVSDMCCYEKEAYPVNTTISSSMSEDGCAKAVIDCVEEKPGNAKMVLTAENYCKDNGTKDQLEDKNETLLEDMEVMEVGSKCQGENVEAKNYKADPKVLLIGPSSGSVGRSEVLSLPELRPLDCKIPVFPGGEYYGYVGRFTGDGVLMCGGRTDNSDNGTHSSCYLLTSSGYQDMPGLINKRAMAASLVTPLGLWVTGGDDGHRFHDTTELVTNNQSRSHVRLPEGVTGHCLIRINQTHYLLAGGFTGLPGPGLSTVYLYSEEGGFTKIADIGSNNRIRGCSVINNSTVVFAGAFDSKFLNLRDSKFLDLRTLTWSPGPKLPHYVSPAYTNMVGNILIGRRKIFKLVEEIKAEGKQWRWITAAELKYSGKYAQAFVVNQNVFCKTQLD